MVESGDPPLSAEAAEEARRDKLKQAGDAYFQALLAAEEAQSDAGTHPAAPKPTVPSSIPLHLHDPDFLQVEAVVEGSKVYVLGTLLVASQAASLVFIKVRAVALRWGSQ